MVNTRSMAQRSQRSLTPPPTGRAGRYDPGHSQIPMPSPYPVVNPLPDMSLPGANVQEQRNASHQERTQQTHQERTQQTQSNSEQNGPAATPVGAPLAQRELDLFCVHVKTLIDQGARVTVKAV